MQGRDPFGILVAHDMPGQLDAEQRDLQRCLRIKHVQPRLRRTAELEQARLPALAKPAQGAAQEIRVRGGLVLLRPGAGHAQARDHLVPGQHVGIGQQVQACIDAATGGMETHPFARAVRGDRVMHTQFARIAQGDQGRMIKQQRSGSRVRADSRLSAGGLALQPEYRPEARQPLGKITQRGHCCRRLARRARGMREMTTIAFISQQIKDTRQFVEATSVAHRRPSSPVMRSCRQAPAWLPSERLRQCARGG